MLHITPREEVFEDVNAHTDAALQSVLEGEAGLCTASMQWQMICGEIGTSSRLYNT